MSHQIEFCKAFKAIEFLLVCVFCASGCTWLHSTPQPGDNRVLERAKLRDLEHDATVRALRAHSVQRIELPQIATPDIDASVTVVLAWPDTSLNALRREAIELQQAGVIFQSVNCGAGQIGLGGRRAVTSSWRGVRVWPAGVQLYLVTATDRHIGAFAAPFLQFVLDVGPGFSSAPMGATSEPSLRFNGSCPPELRSLVQ